MNAGGGLGKLFPPKILKVTPTPLEILFIKGTVDFGN